jgi:hypothetical protein
MDLSFFHSFNPLSRIVTRYYQISQYHTCSPISNFTISYILAQGVAADCSEEQFSEYLLEARPVAEKIVESIEQD